MRRLKLIDGSFTLESKARLEETDHLCDNCGLVECSIRLIMNRVKLNRFNAKLEVLKCESYMPKIAFRDSAGMEGGFNTFRLGGAWVNRVAEGSRVQLVLNNGQPIGEAIVKASHVGTFLEMNARFGADNHLAIAAELEGQDFNMAKVLTECYGGHRFKTDSTISVIELERQYGVGEER